MPRLDLSRSHRMGFAAVLGLETYSRTHLDTRLYELVKLRASLLNRCTHCIDMHSTALRERGEPQEVLDALAQDPLPGDLFTPAERAALALTDAVTRLGEEGVTDAVWDEAASHYDDKHLGTLVLAIATINVWNRIAIATRLDA
ncbi:carboxymuconolactone decarboxylase family protein [Kytococcus sedentarius]|uniref:carboxymuconolactone decarboxylase family protein n=1 Tax=Kytococcus sedentarius TaxID=1276 RepID=UPI0035BC3565